MLRRYEMLTIFSPHLNDEDLTAAIDQVQGYITERGGAIVEAIKDSPWGRRRLAYTIRHNGQDLRDGFYVLFYYDLAANEVEAVERLLHLNDRVVRHMVVKIDEKRAAKQAAAAAKHAAYLASEDQRRGGRGDRFERGDRPERSDRPARPERTEQAEAAEPAAQAEQPAAASATDTADTTESEA